MYNSIEVLVKSKKTIFSMTDLAVLWKINNKDTLKAKVYYLTQKKKIKRLHQGIFAVDEDYNKFELAGKLKNPSYISLETVLAKENVIFQYNSKITSISNLGGEYHINGDDYKYRKIKNSVLYNDSGLEVKDNYTIASKERAFLDMLYFNKEYYFDNLSDMDWKKCKEIVKIYKNNNLSNRLNKYVRQK